MANLHDRFGRPLGTAPRRRRRRASAATHGRPVDPSAPPNPRAGAGSDRAKYEVHEEDYEHDGFAGIPEHGGGGTVIVEQPAPRKEKFGWLKIVATGVASAVGGIIAYRAYEATFGKNAPSASSASQNPAPSAPAMASGPHLQAANLLSQPASPSVNQALALQALASLQAQQQLPDPAPVKNPEEDEEMSYMDEYIKQFEQELEE